MGRAFAGVLLRVQHSYPTRHRNVPVRGGVWAHTPNPGGLHQLTAAENQRLTIENLPDAAVPSAHFAMLQKNIAIAHQIAKNVRNYQREEVARNLNGRGRPRRFTVGQAITYYKACTQPVAGRRAKHSLEWYPGTVTKLLGSGTANFLANLDLVLCRSAVSFAAFLPGS